MIWEAGLTTKQREVELHGDFRCGGTGVLSCNFLLVVVFLFVDSERALLVTGYGTPWVLFGVPRSSFFKVVNRHWV
jgi:hypothetical protein